MRMLAIALGLALVALPAQAQAPDVDVGDPCHEAERTIPLAFDLYAGRVTDASLPLLDRLAERLRACPSRAFELQVHTDTVRLTSFNARQSAAVARHVRELLVVRGVDGARLVACGYGEAHPIGGPPSWHGSPNERLVVRVLTGPASAHRCPGS